jgi:serine phosphatase RsbU (regulator of sigma subunit)
VASEPALQAEGHTGSWSSSNTFRLLSRDQGRRAAMVVALLLAVFDVWLGERYWSPVRYRIFDAYQRASPRLPQRRPVVIVDIDEASIAKLGQWPWPRSRLARLIDATSQLGALVVGLDMIMPEPDRLSLSVLIDDRPDLHPALRAELAMLPSNDAILAETLHRVPSVIGRVGMGAGDNAGRPSSGQTPVRVHGDISIAHVLTYDRHLSNVSAIEEAASGRGYLNDARDTDGVVRAIPLLVVVNGELAPTFALELVRVAVGEPFYNVYGGPQGVRGVQVGTSFIPTDPDGCIRLYYARPNSTDRRRRISALAILNSEVEANALANHVAIIGVTGIGITDVVTTPVAALMEGVEVQAQAIENILDGTRLVRPLLAPWLELGLFLSVAAVLMAFVPRLGPGSGVAVLLIAAGVAIMGSLISFAHWKRLLDPSFPIVGNAVILGVLTTAAFAAVARKRRQLQAEIEAAKLEKARKDGELRAAHDIQMGLVPNPRSIAGLPGNIAFHALLEPAEEVGGDLYDAFMLDAHHFFFLIGDVTGKGVPASLFMALSKTLCKYAALREHVPLAPLMTIVNAAISRDNPANLFVTALAGIIDVRSGAMELCSAGHQAPILLREGELPGVLDAAGGPALCMLEDFSYAAGRVQLHPGDMLVMITDGVTEAQDAAQQFYGLQRALAWLTIMQQNTIKWQSVETICQGLYSDVKGFADGAVPADDITIITIRFKGPLPSMPSSPSG